jgi:thiamine biosynthesis lipoprotein
MQTTSKMKFALVGGEVEITTDAEESMFSFDVIKEGKRLEKIFSLYDPDSELSILNKRRKMKVSKPLLEVLAAGLHFCEMTGGLYDISFGNNTLLAKQGLPLRRLGCSYKDISIDGDAVGLMHKDVLVDLGSIAKGYIADMLANLLRKIGLSDGIVNARGDIVVFGRKELIDIQHPRNETYLGTIELQDRAVATSGDYAKNYPGRHIVHQSDIISATVISKTLMEADAIATCLMVMDIKGRTLFMKKFPDTSALTVDTNQVIEKYNGFGLIE